MNKMILPIGLVVCLIGTSLVAFNELSNPSVKGVSTSITPTPTATQPPTSTPVNTTTPTPTNKPIVQTTQPSPKSKQYGAWYWHTELNRAQVYVATDSAGKDVWADDFPIPTPTPTPQPKYSHSSSFGSVSVSSSKAEQKVVETNNTETKEK